MTLCLHHDILVISEGLCARVTVGPHHNHPHMERLLITTHVYWQIHTVVLGFGSKSNLHSARTLQRSAPQPLLTTSSRTSAAHHVQ